MFEEFSQRVTTGNGVEKVVVSDSAAGLAAAVVAAQAESAAPQPDINVPEHGNMTDVEFADFAAASLRPVEPKRSHQKRSHQKRVVEPVPEVPEPSSEVPAEV